MTVSIATSMYPYRMSLSRKKPVELKIDIKNSGEKAKKITFNVTLSRELAFDKSGLKNNIVQKIDSFKPGDKKNFVFDIFPKGYVGTGEYPVLIKVFEHFHSYEYVEREYTKKFNLTVDN